MVTEPRFTTEAVGRTGNITRASVPKISENLKFDSIRLAQRGTASSSFRICCGLKKVEAWYTHFWKKHYISPLLFLFGRIELIYALIFVLEHSSMNGQWPIFLNLLNGFWGCDFSGMKRHMCFKMFKRNWALNVLIKLKGIFFKPNKSDWSVNGFWFQSSM